MSFQISNSKNTMIESIIYDNKEYIIQNGGNVADYLLEILRNDESAWREYCTEEQQNLVDNMEIKEKIKYFSEIIEFIKSEFNYKITK